jgi:LysR family transcriptional regulator for bpeEF and oprC
MDRLQAMQVFTRIVEMNSFSRAADTLGIPHASATTLIKNLEAHLGVRLLHRTTRKMSLTPEGTDYYERCVRVLAEIEEGESAISFGGKGPRGRLRVDMPRLLGKMIVLPQLCRFHQRYPDIDMTIGFRDSSVDIGHEGIDCALRIGVLQDARLVVKNLALLDVVTAASPGYLERFGVPRSLDDLSEHMAVHQFSARTGETSDFRFIDRKSEVQVKMRGSFAANDAEANVMAGIEGVGVVQLPRFLLEPHLRAGSLTEVLEEYRPHPLQISVVYPQGRYVKSKVRVFSDWLGILFNKCPLVSASGSLEAITPRSSVDGEPGSNLSRPFSGTVCS